MWWWGGKLTEMVAKVVFVKSGSCQGGVCKERWPRPIGGGGSSLDPLLSFKPFHIVARPTTSLKLCIESGELKKELYIFATVFAREPLT